MMDIDKFWKILDRSRKNAEGDPEAQVDELEAELRKLSPEEIIEFDAIFRKHHQGAYDWALWGAAYIIGGGCSDDGFADFRGWLISGGRKVYETALADPDSLVKFVKENDGECQIEGFEYASSKAWEALTGRTADDFPVTYSSGIREPSGRKWEESELDALFPRLAKKFG